MKAGLMDNDDDGDDDVFHMYTSADGIRSKRHGAGDGTRRRTPYPYAETTAGRSGPGGGDLNFVEMKRRPGQTRTMKVSLTKELEEFVRRKAESGCCSSATEWMFFRMNPAPVGVVEPIEFTSSNRCRSR